MEQNIIVLCRIWIWQCLLFICLTIIYVIVTFVIGAVWTYTKTTKAAWFLKMNLKLSTLTSFSTQTDMTESRSAGKHWIDPTLHEHEYARPCISGSRDTGTQTRRSETEDKGVNCSTLHILLTSAYISPDSLFFLNTGLPLKTFRTVLSVMQNMTHLNLPCLFQIKFCWLLWS